MIKLYVSALVFAAIRKGVTHDPRASVAQGNAPRVSRRAQHRALRNLHVHPPRAQARRDLVPQRGNGNGHRANRCGSSMFFENP
jgi:hypothetical protein